MGNIKSALEIALEKTASEKLSSQEIAEIKKEGEIDSILAKYYKDQIGSDQLWHHFKELPVKYLIMAQNNFLRSLSFHSNIYDIEKRKIGFLAIENLKKTNHSIDIEHFFDQLKRLQTELQNERDSLIEMIKEDLERNPEKRLQPFQQGEQIFIKELSVEEVISQDKEITKKFNQLEDKNKESFNRLKDKISILININESEE